MKEFNQMKEFMLTTVDNPYDPFDKFDDWLRFDIEKGYNSCAYLARISHTSEEFTEQENNEEIERAIDEIVLLDPFNIYKKVSREVNKSPN